MEAMKKEHYRDQECWINTITDFYGDTLMNDKKQKCVNKRETISNS